MSKVFNYFFPERITVDFSIISYNQTAINWSEILHLVDHIQGFMAGRLEKKDKHFLIETDNTSTILNFTRGLVKFLDVLYDMFGEDFSILNQSPTVASINTDKPRGNPICVVELFSNAMQAHNPFAAFGNEFFKNNQIGIYIETIEKGIIIFMENRTSFDLCERCICPEFVEAIINSPALADSSPRDYLLNILRILNISPERAPFNKLIETGFKPRSLPFGNAFRQIER